MDITRLPKDALVGKNRIDRKIGQGGYGVVYLAFDLEHKRPVALKFLNKESALASYKTKHADKNLTPQKLEEEFIRHYPAVTERFKTEYQNQMLGIHHPNIAKVYQFGHYEDFLYFTTEYIEGYDIYVFTRGMSQDLRVQLFIQMLEGLQFIHDNGLLHGDIKPENILIKTVDGRPIVKIIDFGIATANTGEKKLAMGTPMYIAPEVILKWNDRIGVSTDLFSAAALMYYCTANTYPFLDRYGWNDNVKKLKQIIENEKQPKSLKKLISTIPDYLDTVVMRLLQRDPLDRFYGSSRAVINALKTRCPNDFKDSPQIKSSYLMPACLIGRDVEMQEINQSLSSIMNNKQPPSAIYCIKGEDGLGKTYFLHQIQRTVEKEAGKILLHSIKFPADDEWALLWTNELTRMLEENKHPLILLIDDMDQLKNGQAIGKIIHNLMRSLAVRTDNPQLFNDVQPAMICFTSNVLISSIEDIPQKTIELKPFTEEDIKTYLKSTVALKEKEISPDWIKMLLHQTEGIPRELEEHLIQLDSSGLLFDIDGNVHLFEAQEPGIAEISVKAPQSTEARILEQYKNFNNAEKHLIELLSIWNFKSITPQIRFIDIQRFFLNTNLHQLLSDLCQKQILEQDHGAYSFINPYFPDLVCRSIADEEKWEIHSKIAGYLREISAPKEVIRFHTGFASNSVIAISNLVRLSRNFLFKKGNAILAQDLLIRVLHLSKTIDGVSLNLINYAYSLLIHAHCYAGKYDKAFDTYEEAMFTASLSENSKLRLYLAILPAYVATRRFKDALAIIDDAYIIATPRRLPTHHILFLNWEARINYSLRIEGEEHLIHAKKIYEESARLEAKLSQIGVNRISNNELGQVLLALGKTGEAVKEMKKRLARCKKGDNALITMLATLSLAEALRNLRKFSQAVNYAQKALKLAREINLGRWMTHIHFVLLTCYFDWGKFDESILEGRRCVSAISCMDFDKERDELTRNVWVNIGSCYNERKKWNESQKYFDAVLVGENGDYISARARLGLAESYLHTKKTDNAMHEIEDADKILAALPNIREDLKFVSKFLRYDVLMDQKQNDLAKKLLPELKILAGDNPVFLKEYKNLTQVK
ncbi:MAG: serine/threonine-protein kinase [Pseudomonadota bacterium]